MSFFVPLLGRFVVFPSIYNFCALLCYHQDVVFSLYLSVYENHVFAQFNVAIDKSLFKLPNFPIEVDSRYIRDDKMHRIIKQNSRGENELVQRIKAKGKRIRDKMKNNVYVRD